MNKKVLISGYIGFSNFGDDAIFSLLIDYLKSQNADITALCNNSKEIAQEHNIKTVQFNSKKIIGAIQKTDVLFSGGGSLLQNRTSNKSLLYYLGVIFLAKILGKKVVIFAQGIGPIKGIFANFLTKTALKMCDIVTVRDEDSQQILNGWKIQSTLLCDPVYSLAIGQYNPRGIVGVQLRKVKNLHPCFLNDLADCVGNFFSDRQISVFSFQNSMDEEICLRFVKILKAKYNDLNVNVIMNSSIDKTVSDFSNLEYLIAMRYHACLLGLKFGVKILPLVYNEKVQTLAKEFQIDWADCTKKENLEEKFEGLKNFKPCNNVNKEFNWAVFDNFT